MVCRGAGGASRDGRVWIATREGVSDSWRAGLDIQGVQHIETGDDGPARLGSQDSVTVIPSCALALEPAPESIGDSR